MLFLDKTPPRKTGQFQDSASDTFFIRSRNMFKSGKPKNTALTCHPSQAVFACDFRALASDSQKIFLISWGLVEMHWLKHGKVS
jgi:hypothetical protein